MAGLERTNTVNTARGDIELGAADVIQRHYSRHVVQRKPVSHKKLEFERRRPRWLRECIAEAMGVFFYVYPGIASIASFVMASSNPELKEITPAFGSFFQIGLAFAIGIAFAIIVCAPTSGGHFNPAITICFVIWQGFPPRKAWYYILSQIFGSFMAGLMLMGQYHVQISDLKAMLSSEGMPFVSATGPASILVSFPQSNQTNLGYLFLIEFFVDSFISLVIWACLDPANPFVAPTTAPWAIGLVYAVCVWGFAGITISTNLARDLGCRIVAAIFFGGEAFTYLHYSWIAVLVNIPATIFGTTIYELVLRDSLQKLGKGAAVYEHHEDGLMRYISQQGMGLEEGSTSAVGKFVNGNGDVEKIH